MPFGECREMNKIIICLNRIYSQIQMLLMQIPSKKKKKNLINKIINSTLTVVMLLFIESFITLRRKVISLKIE
jgi:hypothetical protein